MKHDSQPANCAHYPIVRLVRDVMAAKGLNRRDLGHRLGYSNAGSAFRFLDKCLYEGESSGAFFNQRLARALDLDVAVVVKAFEDTREQIMDEIHARLRTEFHPHLWIDPEHWWPSQVFVVAFCGINRFRYIALPENITTLPCEQQQTIVRQCILERQKEWNGTAGPFGKIAGYQYRFAYDDYWRVTLEGEFKDLIHERPHLYGHHLRV